MSNRDLWIRIGARLDSSFGASFGLAEQKVSGFVKELAKSEEKQRALDDIGTKLGLVGVAATAATGFAVKAAMDWETAWTGVLKTVDGTEAELSTLEGSLRSLAKETGFAHSEVAAVAEAAGQLGISTPGIAKFTETMLAMGVSTNLSAEEASTGLARFRNIMGSTEGDIENMGSTIVGLGNRFATTEAEILAMSMRLAGAGRQAGLSESDVMGLAAAMSSVGIEAEAGGTAMTLTMKRIGSEVDSGGAKLETFARLAGMSAEQFSTLWKNDAASALTAFIAGLDKAGQSGESVNGILKDLGITGIREADALLRLSGNAEGLADALGVAGEQWEKNSALADEAGKFYETSAQKVRQAWASIKDAAIDFGAVVLPIVAIAADAVGLVADAFAGLPGPVQAGITIITGIGGASLIAAAGLAKLTTSALATRTALATLGISTANMPVMLTRMTRAAGMAAGALTALMIAAEAGERIFNKSRDAAGITRLAGDLESFAASGKRAGDAADILSNEKFKNFGEGIQKFKDIANDGSFEKILGQFAGLTTMGKVGTTGPMRGLVKDIQELDLALVELAGKNPEAAAEALALLRDEAVKGGASGEQFAEAFAQSSVAIDEASKSAELLGTNLEALDPIAAESAAAMEEQQKAALETAQSFLGFSSSLDDSKVSLSDWITEMEKQAKALRDFTENAQTAAKKGLDDGLIKSLQEAGPAGAMRMEQLSKASEKEIGRANRAWRKGEDAITGYVKTVGTVPETKSTTVKVRTEGEQKLRDLRRLIDGINGKTVRVAVNGGTGGGITVNEDGGVWDYYANGGFSESHVAQIAPAGAMRIWAEPETGGEAYIPLHPAKRDRSIDIWAETGRRLGVQGFADGGLVASSGPSVDLGGVRAYFTDAQVERLAVAMERGADRRIGRHEYLNQIPTPSGGLS